MTKPTSITIDDVQYIRADSVQQKPNGNRAVVVADRGWIFAGDVSRENGRIKITRALHVLRWESIGFNGMIENPNSNKVTLKPIHDIDMPKGVELFCIPVNENWGL